jgi:hypothetical protein
MNANTVVQQAWGTIQQLYGSQVEDQIGGKKGKGKGKKQDQQNPLQMITSQDPHEKIQGMYALWSKMPPPIYGSLYQASQNATAKAQAIKTDQGIQGVQQSQNQLDQTYLDAKNEKNQIAQGTWKPPDGQQVTPEERVKTLDKIIDDYEKTGAGSWKPMEYVSPDGTQRMTLSYNGKDGRWLDGNGQPIAGPPEGWQTAPKPSTTKPPKVNNVPGTHSILDITDSSGKTWTEAELAKGMGGDEVQSLYKTTLTAQDQARADAATKSQQWYAHANYTNGLEMERAANNLQLKVGAREITDWGKLDDVANADEGMYQRAIQQASPQPTATSDQALLIAWVRSNIQGAGRLNTTEIQQGLRAGSYGTKAQNAWDLATKGTLSPEIHNDFLNDIRNAAQVARDQADQYKKDHNIQDSDLSAIADYEKNRKATPEGASKGFVDVDAARKKPKYAGKSKADVIAAIKAAGYTPTEKGIALK